MTSTAAAQAAQAAQACIAKAQFTAMFAAVQHGTAAHWSRSARRARDNAAQALAMGQAQAAADFLDAAHRFEAKASAALDLATVSVLA